MQEKYYDDLLHFIKANPNNWKELLKDKPYYVTVKQCPFKDINMDYEYLYMLSYNLFLSDLTLPIAKACRGCIVSVKDLYNPVMVCTPFYKFFNYGE